MVDFDDIDNWAPQLSDALSRHVSDSVKAKLLSATPRFIEDARDLLFEYAGRDLVIDATLDWIRSTTIAGYHGSRLTDFDVAIVKSNGLTPLKAENRRQRITRALSGHSKWREVADQLDIIIHSLGSGGMAGKREGQVHLTLSKAGLTLGFNHYLTHGSEFDQWAAFKLLGDDGVDLLKCDGEPRIIKVSVPGDLALEAAHPHFSVNDLRAKGDVPNLVNAFLKAWSFRLAHKGFQSSTLEIDCGMVFRRTIPAEWIANVETPNTHH